MEAGAGRECGVEAAGLRDVPGERTILQEAVQKSRTAGAEARNGDVSDKLLQHQATFRLCPVQTETLAENSPSPCCDEFAVGVAPAYARDRPGRGWIRRGCIDVFLREAGRYGRDQDLRSDEDVAFEALITPSLGTAVATLDLPDPAEGIGKNLRIQTP